MQRIKKSIWILILVSVIVSVVMGIMGIIIHKRCGYYPSNVLYFPKMLKYKGENLDIPAELYTEDAADYMGRGLAALFVTIIFGVNIILANIISFANNKVKEIISICSLAGSVILSRIMIVFPPASFRFIFYLTVALSFIWFITMMFSKGGLMIIAAALAFRIHTHAVPFIMSIIAIPLKAVVLKILKIFALIIVLKLLIGSIGFSGSDIVSSAASGIGKAASHGIDKMRRESESLDKQIKDKKYGLQKHREGSIGYFGVKEEYASREIRDLEKRKRVLDSKLNK